MKKLLALILVLLMMVILFVGCGGDDAVVEDSADDVIEETNYNLQLNAFFDDNGERYFTVDETFEEEPQIIEYNNISYVFMERAKVGDILEENYTSNLKIVDDADTFLGWLMYEYKPEIDEFGNDMGTFEKVDDTLYTTEQILNMEIDCTVEFLAKWSDIEESYYTEYGY